MKKKLLKSVSVVALSAVMMCGTAAAFAGCGGSDHVISISLFCNDSDVDVNRDTCNKWAAEYTEKLRASGEIGADEEVTVNFNYDPSDTSYFDTLMNEISDNSEPDVFYVSPKYVKTWQSLGKILDLTEGLTDEESKSDITDVWEDALALYAYSSDTNFNRGDRIQFNESKNAFETIANGTTVGIYGLPKDYSNFGLGFNQLYFTNENREALTSKTTNDRTGTHGAQYKGAELTYGKETGIITYDAAGKEDAPIISIGKPVYYRPYNFYVYANYDAALAGGDPVACAVDYFTQGEGYCVTIPGFPGDTFEQAKAYWGEGTDVTIPENMQNKDAAYDSEQGYITYTYAEYSALTWAVTYYFNTFNWDNNADNVGGFTTAAGRQNVYGNDQYDGVLYLLPWLAGNNVQYLNADSTKVWNSGVNGDKKATDIVEWEDAQKNKVAKEQLNGTNEPIDMVWGVNTEDYIETVGAFHAYGSDWNGNSNNTGDTDSKESGWNLFVAGACVFYGVGTWNSGPLNASKRDYLQYRLMPEPVSEDYALYSLVKGADYQYGEGVEGSEYGTYKAQFTGQEIFENQLNRQDKWGARMDSVGYGVSSRVANEGWKKDAAISLVKYFTINRETQVTLTYAGSQLPNFKSQCVDFYNRDGVFADMVTPDNAAAWEATYQLANRLYEAKVDNAGMSVHDWMAANGNGTNYDTQYDSLTLDKLADLSYAMKILKMSSYYEADRDISLRMQFGLNATRDSAMYTYKADWLGNLDPRGKNMVMAYAGAQSLGGDMIAYVLPATLKAETVAQDLANRVVPVDKTNYATPAWFCLHQAALAQGDLNAAITEENGLL